jgi:hypothetical protein
MMTRRNRRSTGGCPPPSRTRRLAGLCGTAFCLPALAACTSAGTTAARPADSAPAASGTFTPAPYAKPLLRCTSAQQSAATGSVRVLSVISSQTVHVTVGERVDISQNWAPMRPGGTGVGELWLGAGQQAICQSGNVEGRFTYFDQGLGERLPLIITQAGRAEIKFVAEYVEGGSAGLGIVYIDATPNRAAH